MRRALLLVLALASLAGCASPQGVSPASLAEPDVGPDGASPTLVYAARELSLGASPAHPSQAGDLLDGQPAFRVDRFELPAPANLTVALELLLPSFGNYRVDVLDANGTSLWTTGTILETASMGEATYAASFEAPAGAYVVHHRAAGLANFRMEITAA